MEMTVTADRAFGRSVWWADLRQNVRLAMTGILVAVVLIAASIGATVAESPWFTVIGLLGLAVGALLLVVVAAWPFQRRVRETSPIMQPVRYVFAPDGVEWTTESSTVRLFWPAIRGVRLLPYAYMINRSDGGAGHLICRTTLTPIQDAQLRAYFATHLAEKSTTTGA
jgi:general stress protein CsbA